MTRISSGVIETQRKGLDRVSKSFNAELVEGLAEPQVQSLKLVGFFFFWLLIYFFSN